MRASRIAALTLFAGLLCGCSGVCGTWVAKGGDDKSKNPIARVSFCCDGTFTAEADYGPKGMKAMSGHYKACMGKLCLDADGQQRCYEISVKGDEMTVGKTHAKMTRMK